MEQKAQGGPADLADAVRLLRRAAAQDLPNAQFTLGLTFEEGKGVAIDQAESTKYMRLAAQQGYPQAEDALGFHLEHGIGVAENLDEAIVWYRRAADQGQANAMHNLAGLYATGKRRRARSCRSLCLGEPCREFLSAGRAAPARRAAVAA